MSSENPPAPETPEPAKGLPPVQPPSGRFIAQLFVVPGLIVLLAVLLLLAFRYAIGSGYTPASFLKQLDNDNTDIRWRGASDLAQVLKRPESVALKTDVGFALDLTERLKEAFDALLRREAELEATLAGKTQTEKDAAWRKLKAERNHVRFLAAALGDFFVPVGGPVLAEIAVNEKTHDVGGNTLRRRQAVWALGHMGANTKEFAKLPVDKKAEIVSALEAEAAGAKTARVEWARTALFYLAPERLVESERKVVKSIEAELAKCGKSEDRYLREQTALAISFWGDGPVVIETLRSLAKDDGWGTLVRVPGGD
jgi:hypothetical protein